MEGKICDQLIYILIDPGSNYSYVSPNLVDMLGPYNISDSPITIVVVSLISIVMPLLSPDYYYCSP